MQTGTDEDDWGLRMHLCAQTILQDGPGSSGFHGAVKSHFPLWEFFVPASGSPAANLALALCTVVCFTDLSLPLLSVFSISSCFLFSFSDQIVLPHLVRLVRVFLASFQGCTNSAKTSDKCLPRLAKPSNTSEFKLKKSKFSQFVYPMFPVFVCFRDSVEKLHRCCFDLIRETTGSHVQVSKCLLLWSSSGCNKGKGLFAKLELNQNFRERQTFPSFRNQPRGRKDIPPESLEAKPNI